MRNLLGVYSLKNLQTGEYEEARLYSPIINNNSDDFEDSWKPLLEHRIANLGVHETAASANVQDAHWKWREKMVARKGQFHYESFVIECGGMTQGLMFIKTIAFAQEPSQKNQFMIYVDLVSTAPWNRIGFTDDRLYEGVGPLLLGTAISYSMDQGYEGRLGLHAIPQSESWYRDKCGMVDLGPDSTYPTRLRYFEMTAEQAQLYIST